MQHCRATKDAWRNKRILWEIVAGKLSLCLIYELSHNIFHILRTCCHCAESSAEDKLAFKWGKLFSFYACSKLLMQWLWLRWEEADWCFPFFFFIIIYISLSLLLLTQKRLSEHTCSFFFSNTPCIKLPEFHSFRWELQLSSLQPETPMFGTEQLDWCKLSCLKDHSADFEPYLYSVCVKQRYVNAPYTWRDQCIL